ncbi:MAG: hypothetical protein AAF518_12775 [Spirochaetota bacterium]
MSTDSKTAKKEQAPATKKGRWARLKAGTKNFSQKIMRISLGNYQKSDSRFLFFYFSWFACILFVTSFTLVGKNPFSLLQPYNLFKLPKSDSRKAIPMYLSDGNLQLYPTKRNVFWEDKPKRDILNLIGEIGKSPFYEMDVNNDTLQLNENLKKLPNLQTSVRVLWFIKNNKHLVVDLRKATILEELNALKFRITGISDATEKQKLIQERKIKILHSTFLAIEKSIFANFQEVRSIEYRLDGKVDTIEGLEYDLAQSHPRS